MKFNEFKKLAMYERKKICPRKHPVVRAWVTYIMQFPAIPFSYILSKFKVTANQVSVLRVVISLIAIPMFLLSNKAIIIGLFVFYFALISDCMDGHLARYFGTCSLDGSFFDSVTSAVMFPCMLIATGLTIYTWTGQIWGLLLVAFILGLNGISERAKNVVIWKLLFGKNTSLNIDKRSEEDKKIAGDLQSKKQETYPQGIRYPLMLLLMHNHFLILRVTIAIVLGMILNNNPIVIYLFLSGTLFLKVISEIRTSVRIYQEKDITKFINWYSSLQNLKDKSEQENGLQ